MREAIQNSMASIRLAAILEVAVQGTFRLPVDKAVPAQAVQAGILSVKSLPAQTPLRRMQERQAGDETRYTVAQRA